MKKLEDFKRHLKAGEVYRRSDLMVWSKAVDRHLHQLVKMGVLEKLSGGLYYVPTKTAFGKAPAREQALISTFLKDNRFVVTSPNDYNGLGVGTTQLYNTRRVYNYKRHGDYKLGSRLFHFVRKPYVPPKVTAEFLLIDLANNYKHLAEDQPALLDNIKKKVKEMDLVRLKKMAENFGTVGTKKLLTEVLLYEKNLPARAS